ncbi:MAG: hypothetical protein ACN6PJ_27440 [Achromobacter sp.]|uniref:hypothetical protein n=1 Tax=Achromobacter sp. TaxID=134375 RepID=UPI003D04B3A9
MKPDLPQKVVAFRAPPDVRAWLEEKARIECRTINSQVSLIVRLAMQADQLKQETRQ